MQPIDASSTTRCAACGFDAGDWTRRDLARTLLHAGDLRAGWTDAGASEPAPAGGSVLADRPPQDAAAVHALWHELVTASDRQRRRGRGAPRQRGVVAQLNRSGGGVPKLPVLTAEVDHGGLVGDVQAVRQHHGRPWQALCLWSAERIEALAAEGHPIAPGAAGENVTVRGLRWGDLRAGTILDVGTVRCQLSAPAVPCRKIRHLFRDGHVRRIDHDRHPGWSRWYASVLRPGVVASGDVVDVEPTSSR